MLLDGSFKISKWPKNYDSDWYFTHSWLIIFNVKINDEFKISGEFFVFIFNEQMVRIKKLNG